MGPVEARRDGRALQLGGAKQRAVLGLLLLGAPRVVSVDRLAEALYGDAPPATALTQIQGHISRLRRELDPGHEPGDDDALIVTQAPGYAIRPGQAELDLARFEGAAAAGRSALASGDAASASALLREALALWRGPPLPELEAAPATRAAVGRLAEMRLAALEDRIEADLALGDHAEVVGELQELVGEEPLRERPRALLMLALYGAGRQADALAAYRDARAALVGELGLEPGVALRELERAILTQDPALLPRPAPMPAAGTSTARAVVAAAETLEAVAAASHLVGPLARGDGAELIMVQLLPPGADLGPAAAALDGRRQALVSDGVAARSAAFISEAPAADLVRLSAAHDAELVVLEAPAALLADGRPPEGLATLLADEPADVALFVARAERGPGPVVVPFAGVEDDWAALEVAARLARGLGRGLRLLGAEGDPGSGRRDASRQLASASLAVQRLVGVGSEPRLVPVETEALAAAAADGALLVLGCSGRPGGPAVSPARVALARRASRPTLLVRRGIRPGGLAPRDALTRLTWSLAAPLPDSQGIPKTS
ncbi:MAG TPA: AfsR/SARP family transcriptional regulator [Miltoncostaeaceae bacterium]|nr:AfsR/SARP family transcriptional regulator [Miltoncostaeaceae bacterium]